METIDGTRYSKVLCCRKNVTAGAWFIRNYFVFAYAGAGLGRIILGAANTVSGIGRNILICLRLHKPVRISAGTLLVLYSPVPKSTGAFLRLHPPRAEIRLANVACLGGGG